MASKYELSKGVYDIGTLIGKIAGVPPNQLTPQGSAVETGYHLGSVLDTIMGQPRMQFNPDAPLDTSQIEDARNFNQSWGLGDPLSSKLKQRLQLSMASPLTAPPDVLGQQRDAATQRALKYLNDFSTEAPGVSVLQSTRTKTAPAVGRGGTMPTGATSLTSYLKQKFPDLWVGDTYREDHAGHAANSWHYQLTSTGEPAAADIWANDTEGLWNELRHLEDMGLLEELYGPQRNPDGNHGTHFHVAFND